MKLRALPPRLATQPARLAHAKPNEHNRIRGRVLQRIRTQYRYAQPLCVRCLEQGIVKLWTDLDHVQALMHGGEDSRHDVMRNRQGLCKECHAQKTREDLQRKL